MALSVSDATYYLSCKEEREGKKKKPTTNPLLLIWISGFGGNTDALKYIYIYFIRPQWICTRRKKIVFV